MKVELLAITANPEELIEVAGRTCYKSEPDGNPSAFIEKRMKQGHESIIEHASATFRISGISRACSHQLVRHRIASYSQQSQRYVEMEDCEFVIPPSIEDDARALELWNEFTDSVQAYYNELRELGIRKEDARFVLPNATPTTIVMTMNFRSLRHFLKLRLDKSAQWEIRKVAQGILRILMSFAPDVFGDLND